MKVALPCWLAVTMAFSSCGGSSSRDDAGGDVRPGSGGAGGSGGQPGGSGGNASNLDGAVGTACGATTWPQPDSGQTNKKYTIDVNGTARQFVVGIPAGYDSSHAHPVLFAWHGLTGTADQIAQGGNSANDVYNGYYGQRYRSKQAGIPMIFVAGQGLPVTSGGTDYGWPNTNGRDVAFVRAILEWLDQNYCIDHDRIFSTGFSYGGIMSNTLGCAMGDVFRAIAPMSGGGPYGTSPKCVGQVAAWLAHGTNDPTVAVAQGRSSRDVWLAANHCGTTTVAFAPSPCVAYEGCDAGKPVVWCEFDGVHEVKSFEPQGIWSFFLPFLQ